MKKYAIVPVVEFKTPFGDTVQRYASIDECGGKITIAQIEDMAENFHEYENLAEFTWDELSKREQDLIKEKITYALKVIGLEVEKE